MDFYIQGLIDIRIYNVNVMEFSGRPTIIGEIINEGNEDALFGFVMLKPIGDSNISEVTQFIDEIQTDSPVPFNIQVGFDGTPRYGEHTVEITARYKDSAPRGALCGASGRDNHSRAPGNEEQHIRSGDPGLAGGGDRCPCSPMTGASP